MHKKSVFAIMILGFALVGLMFIAVATAFAATAISSATSAATRAIRLPNGATLPPSLKPAFDAAETESAHTAMLATQSPHPLRFDPPPTFTPSPTRTPVADPFVTLRIEDTGYSPPFGKNVRATSR